MTTPNPDGSLQHLQYYAQSYPNPGELPTPSHHHLYPNSDLSAINAAQYGSFGAWPPQQHDQQVQFHQQHQHLHQHQHQHQQHQAYNFDPINTPSHHLPTSHLQHFPSPLNRLQNPSSHLSHSHPATHPQPQEAQATWAQPASNSRPATSGTQLAGNGYVPAAENGDVIMGGSEMADPYVNIRLAGAPSLRFLSYEEIDSVFWDAVEVLNGEDETPPPVKKQKPSPPPESASPPQPAPRPVAKPATTIVQRPKTPVDPVVHVRQELQKILEVDDDDVTAEELASKTWGIVSELDIGNMDVIESAVVTILQSADSPTLVCLGGIYQFVGKLRKCVVAEFNKEKKSARIFKLLKLFSTIKVNIEFYETCQWAKVLGAIYRKSEHAKARDLADTLLKRYEHLEKERSRKRADGKQKPAARNTNEERPKASADAAKKVLGLGSSTSAGVKRPLEEPSRGATSGAGAAKKFALGEGRNPITANNNISKPSTYLPARNGTSSISGDRKAGAPGTNVASNSSATSATVAARPKPPASTGFFKNLQGKAQESATKAPTKTVEKKPTTTAPIAPTSSFTSIFAQLKQRQKEEQDREKGIAKAADAAKANEEEKKKKKKKSVRWKTGEDLVQVQLFDWVEPEGEYYGGGSGMMEHGIGGQQGEGAALKNKDMLDDEEDLMDWYSPPLIDLAPLYRMKPDAKEFSTKRGGSTFIETEDSKIQREREKTTLAVFYTSPHDIPDSPQEPREAISESGPEPTKIPLPDEILIRLGIPIAPPPPPQPPAQQGTPDLSSLLASLQKPQPQAPQDQVSNIVASLQALGQQVHQQQQQHQPPPPPMAPVPPSITPAVDISALLASLTGGQQPQPAQQAQQSVQPLPIQIPGFLQQFMPQQSQATPAANAQVSALLQQLTGGAPATAGAALGFPMIPTIPGFPMMQPPQLNPANAIPWGMPPDYQQQQTNHTENLDEEERKRSVRERLQAQAGWTPEESKQNPQQQPPPQQPQQQGGTNTAGQGGAGGGPGWSKKKKKNNDKKKANSLCAFFVKGNCKHGDQCRFSHDPSTATANAGGGNQQNQGTQGNQGSGTGGGNWKHKKKHVHHGRGVDAGSTGGSQGWPGAAELEY